MLFRSVKLFLLITAGLFLSTLAVLLLNERIINGYALLSIFASLPVYLKAALTFLGLFLLLLALQTALCVKPDRKRSLISHISLAVAIAAILSFPFFVKGKDLYVFPQINVDAGNGLIVRLTDIKPKEDFLTFDFTLEKGKKKESLEVSLNHPGISKLGCIWIESFFYSKGMPVARIKVENFSIVPYIALISFSLAVILFIL